jgi:type II secretory pathway pseudopilin PulG
MSSLTQPRTPSSPDRRLPRASTQRGLRHGGERGYVLLVIVALASMLIAVVYRIMPKYAFEAQRDREEELIFRGESYRQAIQLFVRKFGRYPTSLDDLVETNNTRFIRKLYKDPMTEDGEWRLIHIGPGGTFPDSLTGGATQTSGGGTQKTATNLSTVPTTPTGARLAPQPTDPAMQGSAGRPNPNRPTGPTFGEGAIAGVASMSEQDSIRVWNDQTSYNKWEFIFDYRGDPVAMGQQQPAPGQPGPGQPGPGQPAPGQPGSTDPNFSPAPGPGPNQPGETPSPVRRGFPAPPMGVPVPPGLNQPGTRRF